MKTARAASVLYRFDGASRRDARRHCSASDFDEESFIRLLEKSSDTPAARWTALMVWRNTDKYLDLLEETLRVPAEIYRRHIPELQPLFDEEIALTRALLAEDPVRVLREHFFVSLDSDELTLRPQAAVISGAGIWIYDDIFDAEHLMLIGCCFEQVHALAFGSENHLVRLAAQLKAIDDKQRLKIMAGASRKTAVRSGNLHADRTFRSNGIASYGTR